MLIQLNNTLNRMCSTDLIRHRHEAKVLRYLEAAEEAWHLR